LEVNWRAGGIRRDQAHKRLAENGGDLADGLIERGIVIAHERSARPACAPRGGIRFAKDAGNPPEPAVGAANGRQGQQNAAVQRIRFR